MTLDVDWAVRWVRGSAAVVSEHRAELIEIDRQIGDGDHGENMDRGFSATVAKLDGLAEPPAQIGDVLKLVATTLMSTVGGAAGPLYGTLFLQMGSAAAGKEELDLAGWTAALEAGVKGVQARGKAELEDKTMLDALVPARDAFATAVAGGASFDGALRASAEAAERGRDATIPLVARKGRASYLGERSAGHQDPGATSSALLLRTAAEVWRDANNG